MNGPDADTLNAPATATSTRRPALPRWVALLLPIVLLVAATAGLFAWDPAGLFDARGPPVEDVAFEQVRLTPGRIEATVMNAGAGDVTIAQVLVDDAYWEFQCDPGCTIPRLAEATITLDYPWVEEEAHAIKVITTTGATFEHDIEVAIETPPVTGTTLATFALLGAFVGLFPIFLGMTWWPSMRRAGARWQNLFLAFTLGLLAFLAVDTLHESLELADTVPGPLNGVGLVALGASAAFLGVLAVDHLREQRSGRPGAVPERLWVAGLVALGIGLHNLGEGLAIGAAYALGEASLGAFLVVGFTLHNLTEGPAILAPMSSEGGAKLKHLLALGLIAGGPTVLGAWLGGYALASWWATLFLAIATGAIVVVLYEVGLVMRRDTGGHLVQPLTVAGFLAGFLVMWATGLLIAV